MTDKQKPAIHFHDVSFSYGPIKVLEKASFAVHNLEFIALVGPNGSGKTTLLKLLLGLEKPQSGYIEMAAPQSAAPSIGYVPQLPPVDISFPISVAGVVAMGRLHPLSRKLHSQDKAAVKTALEATGLAEFAGRSYTALSGGQRRRVLVARALAANPSLLILDEPAANMDKESEKQLFAILGRLKGRCTILIVTHDMSYVSNLCDRVLCLGDRPGERDVVEHHMRAVDVDGKLRVEHGQSFPADYYDSMEK
jgi:zinc transport system ATP-binding protein